jgi:hypothetical protein
MRKLKKKITLDRQCSIPLNTLHRPAHCTLPLKGLSNGKEWGHEWYQSIGLHGKRKPLTMPKLHHTKMAIAPAAEVASERYAHRHLIRP